MKKPARSYRPANTKLSPEIVRALRADKAAGMTCKQRAEKYGIPVGTIASVDTGLTWWWVR